MQPTDFVEANTTLEPPRNLPDAVRCETLPVYTDGMQCVSCWKMSPWQRLVALVSGRIWVSTLSGRAQPPMLLLPGRHFPWVGLSRLGMLKRIRRRASEWWRERRA